MTTHKNTPPGIGTNAAPGVINNPDPSRAHTRTRVENPAAYFKAWRMAKWGGDFDPVLAAVEEAVSSFSTKNPDADRRIWLKIANRVGAEAFMDAVWQKRSEIGNDRTCLRDPASAFQALLNERFSKPTTSGKGGAV